jgi:ribokinase
LFVNQGLPKIQTMTTRARICVVGSVNVDLIFRTDRLPRPGETLTGRAFQRAFGGKGANQAVTAARLGASVSLIARIGNDALGAESLRHLEAQGLDVTHVRVEEEESTGVAGIVVDDRAQNCILVVGGANLRLSARDVRDAGAAVRSADVLLGQMEVPQETTLEAFRVARAAGVRTILNPAPATVLADELLRLSDLCVPNETEIEALTGFPVTGVAEAEAAAREMQRRGAGAVIVTLGQRGAFILNDEGASHVPPRPVAAVDPTGAGDAFIGSLAVFWSEGLSLRAAAAKANAVAALTVTRPGAQSALPTRAEAEAWFQT